MSRINFFISFGFVFLTFLLFFFFKISPAFAAEIYFSGPIGLAPCPSSLCPAFPSFGVTCQNGASVGSNSCSTSACTGGNVWSKYNAYSTSTCYNAGPFCAWAFQFAANSCSTADKCTSTVSNPYLNAGFCDCTTGGIYKTCCNTSTGTVASQSCVQSSVDTTNPPFEGTCPAGTATQLCGFPGHPDCGAPACAAYAPAQPNLVTPSSWSNGTFYEGASVSFSATVQNQGGASAGGSNTQFRICPGSNNCGDLDSPTPLGTPLTSSLAPNATNTVTSDTWSNIPRGIYSLRVWADINSSVPESNELDNGNWLAVCVEGKPDLPTSYSPATGATGVPINQTLSWTFNSFNNTCAGVMGYQVQFGTTNPPPAGTSITYTGQATGTYNPGTLANSTTYYWRVVKCNDWSCRFGPVLSFTTAAAAPTPTPTPISTINLTVTAPICPGPLVKLDWTTTTTDTQYNIFKDPPSPAITSVIGTSWTSGAETPGQTHTWQVQGIQTGTFSNSKTVVTPACPTPTPIPPTPTPTPITGPTPTPGPTFTISGNVFVDNGAGGGITNNGVKDGTEANYTATIPTIKIGTTNPTSNSGGAYTFSGLTGGLNYNVALTVPSGYIISNGGANPNTNPRTVNVPNANVSNINFGIVVAPTPTPIPPTPTPGPTFTISGNVFVDDGVGFGGIARDGIKNGTEANYAGGTTTVQVRIGVCGTGTLIGSSSTPAGTYSSGSIPAGTYVVCYTTLPSGYQIINPTITPPSFTVTVPCSLGGPGSAVCTSGNLSNLNFAIALAGPWIQSTGTDIRFDNGFNYYIPASATATCGGPNASINGTGLTPGIVFTGDSTANFGQGSASPVKNWVVGGSSYPELFTPSRGNVIRTSYNYINAQIKQAGLTPVDISGSCGVINNCVLGAGFSHGLYIANGNMTFSGQGTPKSYTFPAGNYVILVNGNLTINSQIHVLNGSTVTFIVLGDIIVDPTVGETLATSLSSDIEGFYSTDKNFITGTGVLRLNIAGSVVVNAAKTSPAGTFQLQRDLGAGNANCPAFTVQERPNFILNAPDIIKYQNTIYQEVAP